jgi:hypothetical protein
MKKLFSAILLSISCLLLAPSFVASSDAAAYLKDIAANEADEATVEETTIPVFIACRRTYPFTFVVCMKTYVDDSADEDVKEEDEEVVVEAEGTVGVDEVVAGREVILPSQSKDEDVVVAEEAVLPLGDTEIVVVEATILPSKEDDDDEEVVAATEEETILPSTAPEEECDCCACREATLSQIISEIEIK